MKLDIKWTNFQKMNNWPADLTGFKNFTPISQETVNICKDLESSGNG